MFATARNLLIDRVRREQIVPIEAVADLDALGHRARRAGPGPQRDGARGIAPLAGRARPLAAALPRSRRAAQIEGLSRREIAARMGITEDTVAAHLTNGMRALADILYGEAADRGGKP